MSRWGAISVRSIAEPSSSELSEREAGGDFLGLACGDAEPFSVMEIDEI